MAACCLSGGQWSSERHRSTARSHFFLFYVSKADCKVSYRGGEDVGQKHQSYVSVCYALRLWWLVGQITSKENLAEHQRERNQVVAKLCALHLTTGCSCELFCAVFIWLERWKILKEKCSEKEKDKWRKLAEECTVCLWVTSKSSVSEAAEWLYFLMKQVLPTPRV